MAKPRHTSETSGARRKSHRPRRGEGAAPKLLGVEVFMAVC